MLVPPVVTDEAAGAAELLTVVLLLVVSAFEVVAKDSRPNPNAAADKYLIVLLRETFDTIRGFFSL